MADINKEMKIRISQTGAEETRAAIAGVGSAQENAGKSTGKWTGFIREQRQENRQQNFVLRESAQAITTLSFATIALTGSTGGASKEVQTLSRSLLAGVTSFQGADFAIAGLGRAMGFAPGGVGLAISGVLGLGTALYAFLDNSAEKAKVAADRMQEFAKFVKDSYEGLTPERTKSELDVQEKMLADAGVKLKEAQTAERVTRWTQMDPAERGRIQAATITAQAFVDATQKSVDALKARVEAQKQLDIVERRAADSSLILGQELKVKNLEKELKAATSLAEIQRTILEIAREQIRLDALRRGSGEETFKPGALTPLGIKGARDLNIGKDLRYGSATVAGGELKPVKTDDDFNWFIKFGQRELDKMNVAELRFIGLLDQGVGVMSQAMTFLGVKTDSFIAKLLDAMNTILSIMKVIEGIKTISSIVGLMSGNPIGLVGGIDDFGGRKIVGGENTGGGTVIQVYTMDGESTSKFVRKNRREFVQAINDAARLGIN